IRSPHGVVVADKIRPARRQGILRDAEERGEEARFTPIALPILSGKRRGHECVRGERRGGLGGVEPAQGAAVGGPEASTAGARGAALGATSRGWVKGGGAVGGPPPAPAPWCRTPS